MPICVICRLVHVLVLPHEVFECGHCKSARYFYSARSSSVASTCARRMRKGVGREDIDFLSFVLCEPGVLFLVPWGVFPRRAVRERGGRTALYFSLGPVTSMQLTKTLLVSFKKRKDRRRFIRLPLEASDNLFHAFLEKSFVCLCP